MPKKKRNLKKTFAEVAGVAVAGAGAVLATKVILDKRKKAKSPKTKKSKRK